MDTNNVKFVFKFDENYNPTYINGAFGGVSTQNEIVMNFYLERPPVPNTYVNPINQDGTLGEPISIDPVDYEQTVIRFVSTGVVCNEATAKSIYRWLGKQIEDLEKRITYNNGQQDGENDRKNK